ncbi:MAG: hypothetical protein ACTHJ4_01645, partial [Candidatus Nucleicultricaceae bacterium]
MKRTAPLLSFCLLQTALITLFASSTQISSLYAGGDGGYGGGYVDPNEKGAGWSSGDLASGDGGAGGSGADITGSGGSGGGGGITAVSSGGGNVSLDIRNNSTVSSGVAGDGNSGNAGSGGGGGGGTGIFAVSTHSSVDVVIGISATILGGAGGQGGGNASLPNHGGGGGGGSGVFTSSGTTTTIINNGTITGGTGGASGSGGGGGGGAAVFTSLAPTTITNNGTIIGGDGGMDGAVGNGGSGGMGEGGTLGGTRTGTKSQGGVGILNAQGNVDVITSGSISGGLGGDGVTRANAIRFRGNNNTLELQSGYSFVGNVVNDLLSTNNTFILGGSDHASFDATGIDTQYQNFTHLRKTGVSTWTLDNTTINAYNLPWQIEEGTIRIENDAALGAGDVSLSGATLQAGGNHRVSNNIVTSAQSIIDNADYHLILDGDIVNNSGHTLNFIGNGSTTVNSVNSGVGSIINNSGTLNNIGTLINNGTFNAGLLNLNAG